MTCARADVEPAEKLLARIRTERRTKWEEAELAKLRAEGKPPMCSFRAEEFA